MTAPNEQNSDESAPGNEEEGPYRLAEEADGSTAPQRAPQSRRSTEPEPDLSDSEDKEPGDDGPDEDVDDSDSLPPPISREGNPQPWLVIAGICAALLLLSWLAGAPQLSLPDPDGNIAELTFGQRLNGLARTLVFLPLAMLAAVFGLGALAFVRQRPIGAAAPLFAKSLAIVCLATLVWLVPSDIRILKQALHVIGMPALAAALAVPIFRLHPRDAVFATASALIGMILLVLGAWVIVWAAV